MKYLFGFILILTIGCNVKTKSTQEGYNFLLLDKEDTANFFFYPTDGKFLFHNSEKFDSAIFDKAAQQRLPGKYLMGIIEKDRLMNRYLTFKGKEHSKFEDFDKSTELFLHEEYDLKDYEVAVYNDYIDSGANPISRHLMLVAVKESSRDTLLFQEFNIVQKADYVVYSMVTYETWEYRDEMHELLVDITTKMGDSTKVEQRNKY
ncbi:MAG: hypothetical protein AAFQ94_15215 [Bacteroidota bacterium]